MFLLIAVLFFYGVGNAPQVQGASFSSAESCQTAGLAVKALAEKDTKVRALEFKCVEFPLEDKS